MLQLQLMEEFISISSNVSPVTFSCLVNKARYSLIETRFIFCTDTFKDVILRVSNVLFPMFKTFTQHDMKAAKITIISKYDPVSSWTDPTYVVKVRNICIHI